MRSLRHSGCSSYSSLVMSKTDSHLLFVTAVSRVKNSPGTSWMKFPARFRLCSESTKRMRLSSSASFSMPLLRMEMLLMFSRGDSAPRGMTSSMAFSSALKRSRFSSWLRSAGSRVSWLRRTESCRSDLTSQRGAGSSVSSFSSSTSTSRPSSAAMEGSTRAIWLPRTLRTRRLRPSATPALPPPGCSTVRLLELRSSFSSVAGTMDASKLRMRLWSSTRSLRAGSVSTPGGMRSRRLCESTRRWSLRSAPSSSGTRRISLQAKLSCRSSVSRRIVCGTARSLL
mmetsp:Transcript_21862/g.67059  ORF Transcript_21862/g.67059 Transcript_21862/m.67059 type:complete len:284 (+) Transcript_21862:2046-2897(+)